MKQNTKILLCAGAVLGLGFFVYHLLSPVPFKKEEVIVISQVVRTESQEAWRDYSPPNQLFSVSLPNLPQHVASTVPLPDANGTVRYDVYLAQTRVGTTFIINAIQYPDSYDTSNPDEVFQSASREMVNGNPANKLVREERGMHQGYPCSDFILKNQDVSIRSRAILVGKRLYILTVADRDPQLLQEFFSKFVDSFKIEKQ